MEDVVLRHVDTTVTEDECLAALLEQHRIRAVAATRFRRTAKAARSPLPLIRVCCSSAADCDVLLRDGLHLGGRHCPAERARASRDSAAALGCAQVDGASADALVGRLLSD